MEVREIKTLLGLMRDYDLVELEIEDKKGKVRLVRAGGAEDGRAAAPAPARQVAPKSSAQAPAAQASSAEGGAKAAAPDLGPNQRLVESPMVGTFYRAASPDGPPFVEQGDSVRKGQPLCIIEAMKMMNEIEAPAAGRIVKLLCENGQAVEYGQPLFVLEAG